MKNMKYATALKGTVKQSTHQALLQRHTVISNGPKGTSVYKYLGNRKDAFMGRLGT